MTPTRSAFAVLALVFATLLPLSAGVVAAQSGPSVTIRMQDNRFLPAQTTVAAGTTVTWTNLDGEQHNIVSSDDTLDSPMVDPDGSWSFTFTDPGVYSYVCEVHDGMVGTIEVTGS